VSLFFPEHNPTTTLGVYSFNTFTYTSFDAQNIVSELLPSPKAYHGAPANHNHSCYGRMPAERKGDRFQRLHIDQGSTEYEPHCRSWLVRPCAELTSSIDDG
jgi:hypothetical protein